MDISIIIPFYKGNNYLKQIEDNLKQFIFNSKIQNKFQFEVIIVNDSPNVEMKINEWMRQNVQIINNEINSGIHFSRVHGLKYAKGKFIQFMDQDDSIDFEKLELSLASVIDSNVDVIVNNGKLEFFDGTSTEIYSNLNYKKSVLKESSYLNIRDLIVSPGQCLINKSSIYFHSNSGENLSLDISNWKESLADLERILAMTPGYPQNKLRKLHRLNLYKLAFAEHNSKKKLTMSVKNFDLFIINVVFRISNGSSPFKIKGGEYTK
ncbi:Glycosyl transferase, family 2 [Latilactobacillus sakei]|nr:Glycosyl transferase, family 2 [Latilactobacillus sakei]